MMKLQNFLNFASFLVLLYQATGASARLGIPQSVGIVSDHGTLANVRSIITNAIASLTNISKSSATPRLYLAFLKQHYSLSADQEGVPKLYLPFALVEVHAGDGPAIRELEELSLEVPRTGKYLQNYLREAFPSLDFGNMEVTKNFLYEEKTSLSENEYHSEGAIVFTFPTNSTFPKDLIPTVEKAIWTHASFSPNIEEESVFSDRTALM